MVIKSVFKLPVAKTAVIVGFIAAAALGCWVAGFAFPTVSAYINASLLAFSIKASITAATSLLFAGTYMQLLRDFKLWPVNDNNKISFRPRALLNDVSKALRSFDWEVLKYISHIWLDNAHPQLAAALESEAPVPNNSWVGNAVHSVTEGLKNLTKRAVAPAMLRDSMCKEMHQLHFYLQNASGINGLSKEDQARVYENERHDYTNTPFIKQMATSDRGFFQSLASAAYNEYEHPPTSRRVQAFQGR